MVYDKKLMVGILLLSSFLGGAFANFLLGEKAVAQGSQSITTSQINLVDDAGRVRGELSAQDDRGAPSLIFYDQNGQMRTMYGIEQTGSPLLRLQDAQGEDRLEARLINDDALLIVGDDQERHAVLASVGGVPVLNFAHGRRGRAQFQLNDRGSPSLMFFGQEGQRSAEITVDDADTPLLTLYQSGRPLITLGIVQDTAVLNMAGPEQSRLVLGVAGDGNSTVTFIDESGQVVGQLPTLTTTP
tara:strand:- start:139 stop:867 length:729 start_codon:yes stop_codon:yes gene_type:complete